MYLIYRFNGKYYTRENKKFWILMGYQKDKTYGSWNRCDAIPHHKGYEEVAYRTSSRERWLAQCGIRTWMLPEHIDERQAKHIEAF